MHQESSFLTLTFNDKNLPEDYSVNVRHVQLFMKRLRKYAGSGIKFFACGEYGDKDLRPHYHVLVFGWRPKDATPWRKTGSGHIVYRSEILEALWPAGYSELGSVTPESAGYVARYIMKKVNGDPAEEHYTRVHPLTGRKCRVRPEFITMSRRPGIAATWFDKYSSDCFPKDFVTIEGKRTPIPPAFLKKLEDSVAFTVKGKRSRLAQQRPEEQTTRRLMVREESLALKVQRLKRELDNGT